MAKKQKKVKFKLRTFLMGVLCIFLSAFFLYNISKTVLDINKKIKEKKEVEKRLISLKEEEERLTDDVEKLKNPEYVARYLREKYLYSTNGEYIIRIPSEGESEGSN